MTRRLHVHLPWRELPARLPALLSRGLQPEIGLQGSDLDRLDRHAVTEVGRTLATAGLAVTVHAPFTDLNPGARDPLVRDATRQRLEQALGAAGRLGAGLMVVHPGYDRWHYDHDPRLWMEQALPFFRALLPAAEECGVTLALENIFEPRAAQLVELVGELDHPQLGHCFDIGHWHLFAEESLGDWLTALGDKLVHLHLHDNRGRSDEHLPPGEGSIDFAPLNAHLGALAAAPSLTLEAHCEAHLERGLLALPHILPAIA